ncbi:alkyl hydroperoxide reductase thiol specific antioxidant mal allergen [Colletotrichum chrysophilum]|uniref:Alkyl hydroperoxide reductase thiol specific antioxidant mal allergen n=1 Tax=Colletotrichum chrysophilum TaxID=1836956 RepID=A0AAD9AI47_9PEZI|nr:alkyl hydroperoxide reductase thiol specific antioxidant mal allergen [Colletotrichum chrysophilum]
MSGKFNPKHTLSDRKFGACTCSWPSSKSTRILPPVQPPPARRRRRLRPSPRPLPPEHPAPNRHVSALAGLTLIFVYPRSTAPGEVIPPEWDAIHGARGCTPQACSYRDNAARLAGAGVAHLFGVSTQTVEVQREFREREHLPYELLSDAGLEMARGLGLPTFEYGRMRLLKRVTMAVEGGRVVTVWYPVFPADRNVEEVLEWLEGRRVGGRE